MNNYSEKVLIRILSVDEFKNYLHDSTLNDNVVKCSADVWNNFSEDNRYSFGGSMNGDYRVFPELSQNDIKSKHDFINGLTNYTYNNNFKLYGNNYWGYGGVDKLIDKTRNTPLNSYTTYSPSFRPVFNYIDNTKSTNLFY
jgi:hypothetical protein